MNLMVAMLLSIQQPGIDVHAYSFRIELPDSGDTIVARAGILFLRPGRGPDTLKLDLVGLTVDSVTLAPANARRERPAPVVPFTYDGRVISIPLTPAGRAPAYSATVYYHGRPSDGLIFRVSARGRRTAFGDNWPNRARHWLPTVDHPSDKALVAWDVRAPAGWRVVANGMCHDREGRTFCVEGQPIPTYTMVIGAGVMTVSRHPDTQDGVPIEVWAYAEDSAFADSVPFRRATAFVDVMERLVGDYSYEKLAHVQSSTRYGGMENSSAIFYAENGYVRRTMGEGVVRHEIAHQWFGDAATAREWHHVWLSEGFATYFDAVIAQQLDGDTAFTRIMRGNRDNYMRSNVVNRPIVDTAITDPNNVLNANTYPKAAWVLHMLRLQIGDSAFFRSVRNYYARYEDSTALSIDFQRIVERTAALPLEWFFRQWLWQPGYPQLEVTWDADPVTRQVRLRVRQAQPAAWGRFRVVRVPVVLMDGDVVSDRRTFTLDGTEEQVVSYNVSRVPTDVRIDPDGTMLLTAQARRGP